jgi:alginate O-acetyltransferase complex protein AlgI
MAVGLALMFGILLPFNFASPYKSRNIIEFWSRWHMTLTRFLTAYVYNPLTTTLMRRRMRSGKQGYNRKKPAVVPFAVLLATPTLITMGLAGLWHGAGWQFIAFGLLHGVMLVLNHAWHATPLGRRKPGALLARLLLPLQIGVTFIAVAISLVFFKAVSLEQALLVVASLGGAGMGADGLEQVYLTPILLVLTGLVIVWALPNTQQWVGLAHATPEKALAEGLDLGPPDRAEDRPATGAVAARDALAPPARRWLSRLHWAPRPVHGFVLGAALCLVLLRALGAPPAEFLYFAF